MAKSAKDKDNKRKVTATPAKKTKVAVKPAAKAAAKTPKVKAGTATKPTKPTKPVAKAPAKTAPTAKAKTKPAAVKAATKPVAKAKPKAAAKTTPKPVAKAKPKVTTKAAPKPAVKAAAKIPAKPKHEAPIKTGKTITKPTAKAAAPASIPPTATAPKSSGRKKKSSRATLKVVPAFSQAPINVEPRKPSARKAFSGMKLQSPKSFNPLEPPANPNAIIHGQKPYIAKAGETYMSAGQLQHFRRILLAWKQELMEEVDRTVHHMQDESASLPDPNDRATQEEEFALELRTRDRERKLIKKIDKTMRLIDDEDYGYCEACGIEIGLRRLEARPTAELCIDCKTLAEIKERQVGTNA